MACYDCDECNFSVNCGGKCDHFEYDCVFEVFRRYSKETISELRNLCQQFEVIKTRMSERDEDMDSSNDIYGLYLAFKILDSVIDEDSYKEWIDISS